MRFISSPQAKNYLNILTSLLILTLLKLNVSNLDKKHPEQIPRYRYF
ncbi:Hypothetical protein ADU72_2163 [Pediococcus damnosus]|uniref:Mobile element protein n=1 Tax=Pediococcus damnosus TaxID=51663 RepID=A0ABN4NCF1_9LACO|nr:Hypothetical protein ADU72_2163 [Pediococcus damnosus]AMV70269.1 Hypothetical protein ADU73_1881 [Pediococcus damnosus]